jgi:predicted MFS family arabinose efflux permease
MAVEAFAPAAATGAATESREIDRAWGTALAAGLCVGLGVGPMALFTFGVFVGPILEDTGWTKDIVAAAVGPATLLLAIGQPLAGMLADRFGVRLVILSVAPLFAACLTMVGLVPQDPKTFSILFALLFFVGAGTAPPPFVQAISGWFDRRRGVALSVVFAGASLGIALMSPLAAALIGAWGWRVTYALLGMIALIAMMPSALFLLKDAPQYNRKSTSNADGLTIGQTLRTGRFWVMFVSFGMATAVIAGCAINLPVILSGRGIAPQQAAFIMTMVGGANFAGRIAMGLMLDRWFSPWATAATWFAPFMAFLLLMGGDGAAAMIVAAALLGFGLGCESDALAYIASRAFGLRHVGAVYGLVFMAYGIGAAVGPALFSVVLQRGGDLSFAFPIAAAIIAAAAALLICLRPRHLPFTVK